MEFATRYAPPESPSITFEGVTMTDSSFKDECDINKIVSRCMNTGILPQVEGGLYGDFVDLPNDLMQSYVLIGEAQERFMQLPSDVRAEFGNEPLALLQFIQDPANKQRAVELGLIVAPADSKAQVVSNVSSEETVVAKTPSDKGES